MDSQIEPSRNRGRRYRARTCPEGRAVCPVSIWVAVYAYMTDPCRRTVMMENTFAWPTGPVTSATIDTSIFDPAQLIHPGTNWYRPVLTGIVVLG